MNFDPTLQQMEGASFSWLRISCVLPTLGRGRILCDTIRMLLHQEYPAYEILVIDQTPDPDEQTRNQLSIWCAQGQIRWLHQDVPNASKARNVGALAATGDVVLFLDDDILLTSSFLGAYAETFQRTRAAGVAGQVLEGDAHETDILPLKATDPETGWLYFPKNYSRECETSFMMAGNVAIQRNLFIALGGMDENYEKGAYREESDFAMRFKRAGHRLHYNPKCSVRHLGIKYVRGGGARSWRQDGKAWYFHHCVGDWYFNLKYSTPRTCLPLFWLSLRYFVIKRAFLTKPWEFIFAFVIWISAIGAATKKLMNGPKTLPLNK